MSVYLKNVYDVSGETVEKLSLPPPPYATDHFVELTRLLHLSKSVSGSVMDNTPEDLEKKFDHWHVKIHTDDEKTSFTEEFKRRDAALKDWASYLNTSHFSFLWFVGLHWSWIVLCFFFDHSRTSRLCLFTFEVLFKK